MPIQSPASALPWQLRLFSKTLKKQQKLRLLLRQIGSPEARDCVLITHGDNNGALNYHFRAHGGHWTWIENETGQIQDMESLLGDRVLHGSPDRLPTEDESFDVVVSIDVHEHLDECRPFSRELARIVRPGGTVIVTTPNGDRSKPVARLKDLLGMSIETYGHKVLGYTIPQHEEMLRSVQLEPVTSGSYSKFFTELLELGLNLTYVRFVQRRSSAAGNGSGISPTTSQQFDKVKKHYRWLSLLYPLLLAISKLDLLLFFTTGYAVSVVARKPAA